MEEPVAAQAKRAFLRGPQYATCAEVPFQRLSHFFTMISGQARETQGLNGKGPGPQGRSRLLKRFFELYMPRSHDTFQIMRLLAPDADRVTRGNYNLQQTRLARALCMAGNIPRGSEQESNVINWRTRGSANSVGDFPEACFRYVLNMCRIPETATARKLMLKVGQVNDKLDELASRERTTLEQKAETLRWFMQNTTSLQMKWIVCIILQNLKIGASEETVIKHYHPEAYEAWGLCQNLKTVCEELRDPAYHPPRKDVEPGLAIQPMLARVAFSPQDVFNKIQSGNDAGSVAMPFLIETKFDGDRYLLHRKMDKATGKEVIKYTSRQGHEHGVKSQFHVFDNVVKAQLEPEDLILDGEMLVWNKTRRLFEAFGTLRSAILAAHQAEPAHMKLNDKQLMREGFQDGDGGVMLRYSDKRGNVVAPCLDEIELIYIAFDILYKGTLQSLITKPLQERSEILKDAIKDAPPEGIICGPSNSAVRGRIISLIPGREWGGRLLSQKGHTKEDIVAAFERITKDDEEEGVVVKRLHSAWNFMWRTNDWVKLKPDYTRMQEIDAVIIGASYGTGELRGGKLSEFVVALRMDGTENEQGIPKFASFCRVGTGLEDAERDVVRDKLDFAGLRQAFDPQTGKHLKNAPSCYHVTGFESVDVWIEDPTKSAVVEVHGDVRPIMSKNFSTEFSLRFPRITRYRDDKGALQCQSIYEFKQLYEDRKKDERERAGAAEKGQAQALNQRKEWEARKKKRKDIIPHVFKPADLSGVETLSDALEGFKVGFYLKDKQAEVDMHTLVKRMRGIPYMNVTEKLDIVLAQEDAFGWKQFCKTARKDVLRIEWLLDPEGPNPGLPPRPWLYLYMCPVTRYQGQEWLARFFPDYHDRHGAPWYVALDAEGKDLANIMDRLIDPQLYEQALKEQEAAAQQLAREREVLLEVGNGGTEPAAGGKQGPKTLGDIISEAEQELASIGLTMPEMSLFRGKVVYVLDMGPEPPARKVSLANMYTSDVQPAAGSEGFGGTPRGRAGGAASRAGGGRVGEGGRLGAAQLLHKLGYTVTQTGPGSLSRESSPEVEIVGEVEGGGDSQGVGREGAPGAEFRELQSPDLSQSGLLHLDACGAELAHRRCAREHKLQDMHNMFITNLQLKVEAHGGTVMKQLAKGVTHILLVPQGASSGCDTQPAPAADVVRALDHAACKAAAASLLSKAAARHRLQAARGSKGQQASEAASQHLAAAAVEESAAAKVEQAAVPDGDPLGFLDEEQQEAARARAARLLKYARRRLTEGRVHLLDWRWVQATRATLLPPSQPGPAAGPLAAAAAAGPGVVNGPGAGSGPDAAALGIPMADGPGACAPAAAAAAPRCLPESCFPPWVEGMAAAAHSSEQAAVCSSGAATEAATAAAAAVATHGLVAEEAAVVEGAAAAQRRACAAWPWHLVVGLEGGHDTSSDGTATAQLSSPLMSDNLGSGGAEGREAAQADQQRRGIPGGGPGRGRGRGRALGRRERPPEAVAPAQSSLAVREAADPAQLRTLEAATVKELKEALKAKGLPVSGTKSELISRLLAGGGSGAGRRKRKMGDADALSGRRGRKRGGGGGDRRRETEGSAMIMEATPSSKQSLGRRRVASQVQQQQEGVEDLTLAEGSTREGGDTGEDEEVGYQRVLYEGSSELEEEEGVMRGQSGTRARGRRGAEARRGRASHASPHVAMKAAAVATAAAPVAMSPLEGGRHEGGRARAAAPQPLQQPQQVYVPLGIQRPRRAGLVKKAAPQAASVASMVNDALVPSVDNDASAGAAEVAEAGGGGGVWGEEREPSPDAGAEVGGRLRSSAAAAPAPAAATVATAVAAGRRGMQQQPRPCRTAEQAGGRTRGVRRGAAIPEIDLMQDYEPADGSKQEKEEGEEEQAAGRAVQLPHRQPQAAGAAAAPTPASPTAVALPPAPSKDESAPAVAAPSSQLLVTRPPSQQWGGTAFVGAPAEPAPQTPMSGKARAAGKSLRDVLGLPVRPKQEPLLQQQQQQQQQRQEGGTMDQGATGSPAQQQGNLQLQQQSTPDVPWDEMLGFSTQMLAQPLPFGSQAQQPPAPAADAHVPVRLLAAPTACDAPTAAATGIPNPVTDIAETDKASVSAQPPQSKRPRYLADLAGSDSDDKGGGGGMICQGRVLAGGDGSHGGIQGHGQGPDAPGAPPRAAAAAAKVAAAAPAPAAANSAGGPVYPAVVATAPDARSCAPGLLRKKKGLASLLDSSDSE